VLVVGATVVVDVDVLVTGTVEVVVEGAVVEDVDEVVVPGVVVVVVVVVGGVGMQPRTLGGSWPMSKAITRERPWRSAKNEPMATGQSGIEWTSTEIGF
jgi:hypothetical protein